MADKPKLTSNEKNLTRRYLIWCYKTTKEDLDRIDRYYTQLEVDAFVLKELQRGAKSRNSSAEFRRMVKDFEDYMQTKRDNVDKAKFKDAARNTLRDEYRYLQTRFEALKKAVIHFLGKKELERITDMYEEEMTVRIIEAEGH